MKTKVKLLFIVACVLLLSCQKNNNVKYIEREYDPLDYGLYLIPWGYISDTLDVVTIPKGKPSYLRGGFGDIYPERNSMYVSLNQEIYPSKTKKKNSWYNLYPSTDRYENLKEYWATHSSIREKYVMIYQQNYALLSSLDTYYVKLKSIKITANMMIADRNIGTDISDLFTITDMIEAFSYPDMDLLYYESEGPTTIAEWEALEVCPPSMILTPNCDFPETMDLVLYIEIHYEDEANSDEVAKAKVMFNKDYSQGHL